ncbi:hypothetical protein LG943_14220 [Streptomonospora sp. S1-112]|uniref:Integral membrane protein n=1 Tax=Streptomonospora mangrovi TaxID=2883123 RepID=A0A9X3NKN6_9ACTN|nr:hypothetical protein [Streptomonospora mangrovi]MDA0565462.1 hypothetical protein [Streptomonospora mangrovi]
MTHSIHPTRSSDLAPARAGGAARLLGSLPLALGADAAVTGANALLYLALAAPLSGLLGVPAPWLLGVGAFLACYAAAVALVARRAAGPRPVRAAVWPVVGLNLAWTAASLAAAAGTFFPLTGIGRTWTVLQAVAVLGFALWQVSALRGRRA